VCPKCNKGYFSENGGCSKCQIPGCQECEDATHCLDCILPQVWDPAHKYCVDPIPDCLTDPQEYVKTDLTDSFWSCPECKKNTLWIQTAEKCDSCALGIADCVECQSTPPGRTDICLSCSGGLIPSPFKDACIPHIPNCLVDGPLESVYFIVGNSYHCSKCKEGYFWVESDMACKTCS